MGHIEETIQQFFLSGGKLIKFAYINFNHTLRHKLGSTSPTAIVWPVNHIPIAINQMGSQIP